MPLYEEKLISPLAVRYTQEHIRTTFRDAHVVEETVAEIQVRPGTGGYDLILEAPFPAIEIIRWCPHGREAEEEDEVSHWFTLDNRRLYCLQRVAALHWPRRVAAKVEILYTDPGSVWRKFDSTSFGAAVTVANSCKEAPLFTWDWNSVKCWSFIGKDLSESELQLAEDAIAADDKKEAVSELMDADADEGPASTLARLLAFEMAAEERRKQHTATSRSTTPSTTVTTADDSSERSPRQRKVSGGASSEEEDLTAQALAEIDQQVQAPEFDGFLRIPEWKEHYGTQLGSLKRFLEGMPATYRIIPEKFGKFRVEAVDRDAEEAEYDGEWEHFAKLANAEIAAQLDHAQGRPCAVRVKDWNARFAGSLGAFRDFIRSQPDEFVAVVGPGNTFKVAPAWARGTAGVQKGEKSCRGRTRKTRA